MTAVEHEWEPGDPLFGRSGFGGYFYNFRPLRDNDPTCNCPDSARWPDPLLWGHRIPEDPLAQFIKEYHEWKNNG